MEVLASPIYVIENPDGSTTFTSRKPRTGRAKVFTAKDVGFSIYRSRTSMRGKLFQSRYRSIIGRVSSRHGIDSSLVRAIIHVESAFNPRARSPKGAMGLMQLMPSVIADSRVRNPYDPEENIRAGVAHFAKLLENLRGNLSLIHISEPTRPC